MTAREIIQRRLNHEGTEITPYYVCFEDELYKRLTEHYQDENWESKQLRQFTVTHLYADTVQMQPLDEIYSKDGYGALWRMDRKPWHLEKNPLEEPDLSKYDFPDCKIFIDPILSSKVDAIKKYEADTEHYRIINTGWGIFEHSWRIRGFENALMDMVADEDFYAEMTMKIADIYVEMIKACADVPADAYLFGDDWGEQRGVIMGRDRWCQFLKPCWARVYEEVHRQGKKVIQHSCGSIVDIYDDLAEIGMDCHESVQPEGRGMAPEELKARFGKKISFWGCLGSQGILHHGTPAEISAEIKRLHRLFKDDGGYVLAPAKPLADEMPLDKVLAVIDTLAELSPP